MLLFKVISLVKRYSVDIAAVTASLVLESKANNCKKRKPKCPQNGNVGSILEDRRQKHIEAVWHTMHEKSSLKMSLAVYLCQTDFLLGFAIKQPLLTYLLSLVFVAELQVIKLARPNNPHQIFVRLLQLL